MEMNLTISGKTRNFFRVFLMSLLLGILMLPAEAQNRVTVSGRLTDTGQNPLIGASVIEKSADWCFGYRKGYDQRRHDRC